MTKDVLIDIVKIDEYIDFVDKTLKAKSKSNSRYSINDTDDNHTEIGWADDEE